MESGLYATFFDEGEALERDLPAVGPLDHLVARHRLLVCERTVVQQTDDPGVPIERWLEAELELQRATGQEPGGPRRSHLRITARDGVLVRFAVFGDASERDPVPEMGPYAAVLIGRHTIEADGQVLATRKASEIAPWELASAAGIDYAGLPKPDVAFRTPTTPYHPSIAAMAQRAAQPELTPPPPPVIAPPSSIVPPPAPVARPPQPPPSVVPAPQPPALTPDDLELIQRVERQREEETLRARMEAQERVRLGVSDADEAATTWAMRYRPQAAQAAPSDEAVAPERELDLRELLWRMRFAIIGVLVLAAGLYGFMLVRGGGVASPIGSGARTVGIAQRVQSDNWKYVVNGVQRTQSAGTARPNGVYYVVRIGVTSRRADGAELGPNDFALVGPDGTQYSALSLASGAYQGPDNTSSPYFWPQSFRIDQTVTVGVIFDLDPSLGRGLQLTLPDLPSVRVKLD